MKPLRFACSCASRLSKFFITCAIIALITLGMMEVVLRQFPVRNAPHTAELSDEQPIPHYIPNMTGIWSRDWNFSLVNKIHVNNYGFVNDQDYDPEAENPLIAVIGDSFVAALMVPNQDTFYGRLSKELAGKMRVYSFGISGAPLSTYLKWAEYVDQTFHPQYIIFSIITNDYDESYYKYKKSPAFYYFVQNDTQKLYLDKVDFHISPWRRYLSRNSSLVAYIRQNVQLTERIKDLLSGLPALPQDDSASMQRVSESKIAVDCFLEQLPKMTSIDRRQILFVVDAVDEIVYDPDIELTGRPAYDMILNSYFIKKASTGGYGLISLQPVFESIYKETHQRFDYPTDGHWNPDTHRIVFEQILESGFLPRQSEQ